jgi:putative peptide zinc metalloprotease protein
MEATTTATDLERRKKVRVRLRPDLSITVQKYEGRTYYVVKDPVSLRYYRFKEQERFLLDLMDGEHTLEDAQKAFEQRFRPERLTLEDLEQFASQLLSAGLAQNESPNAGKQLFDRFKKRRRRKLVQSLLNILYIKVPLYDPDAVLTKMLPPLRFIFTAWFGVLSVGVMLAALLLVASQWNTFIAKLPSYHEFFSFKTLLWLWVALGLVKIIHEFGHGLSCKAYGGEVHEMGLLFLVFSPCLYCNVSDAWTLPSKWKRIIISAAGIYVELLIASLATFVWWVTDSGTFLNNLCMSLMVVCSVSTIVFNANPLMRFDGYYILADWIEIPNLRDRSNRLLQSLALQYCLGIETPPEPYMTRTRQVLFVVYAIASYLYRWLITFSILYFMYTFLKPYKLGAISFLLGTAAVATMIGHPAYRLIKAIRRRGRLPDMKPVRVGLTVGVVLTVLFVILFVPFRVRVEALAVIRVEPGRFQKVTVPDAGGFLQELLVVDGQRVRAGDPIAVLANPELELKLKLNQKEQGFHLAQLSALGALIRDSAQETRAASDYQTALLELQALQKQHQNLKEQWDALVVKAPRAGRVMKLVRPEEQGKMQERGTVLCEIGDDQALQAVILVEPADRNLVARQSKAWIRVHGREYRTWRGTVTEVSEVEAKDIPPALSNVAGGEVPATEDPETKTLKPQQQHYLIAVNFDRITPEDAIHPGAMGRVKIEAGSQTLWWRFRRYLVRTFNWGL